MKLETKKQDVVLTGANLCLWIWAVSRLKVYGDHLGGPHLIALIATMLSVLIWYRAVLAARRS